MNNVKGDYQLCTGVWDKPQIISFDSLFTTYSVENKFDPEQFNKMKPILTKWKELAKDHFSKEDMYERTSIANYVTDKAKITRRTAHVQLSETPGIIYKTYHPNSSALHPMANTLRAPMAALIQDIIVDDNLTHIGVPKKGLYPLFSKEQISTLDEKTINEAFIVCVEKIDVLDRNATLDAVKQLTVSSQEILADQCCQLIMKTGLDDCSWFNMQMHKDHSKLYILDTETLSYELFIDKFGKGFETCATALSDEPTLSSCAKNALKMFKSYSRCDRLEIFENKAATYLEKID